MSADDSSASNQIFLMKSLSISNFSAKKKEKVLLIEVLKPMILDDTTQKSRKWPNTKISRIYIFLKTTKSTVRR